MSVPVLTFFNNKGGVGKTSLVYHIAWMLSELNVRVLAVDLDPQANLTAAFLEEDELADLWDRTDTTTSDTISRCFQPLTKVGDLADKPQLKQINGRLSLLPGDLSLSGFEELLSVEWPNCLGDQNLFRPFRVVTAFWQVVQAAARQCSAAIVLLDVGPSLGAINRSALIATDALVIPLGADLFSVQGLRNLGPTLLRWRADWARRRENWGEPEFELPVGAMQPLGYVVQQHSVRLGRPVRAYDRWVQRIPGEYLRSVLKQSGTGAPTPEVDPNRIATMKHYRSLIALGQDARKPIFELSTADGALGSHFVAARAARTDFAALTEEILRRLRQAGHTVPRQAVS
ncbi:MAG: ParA family protein [Planctomycetes bacterium]|nr:ParA family protein [Planctomycetota bacterium]